MKLQSIYIENWRSIKYTHIFLDNLLILIGGNNSGKSSITTAISALINPIILQEELQNSIISAPLKIKGIFSNRENKKVELMIFKFDNSSDIIYKKNEVPISLEEYIKEIGEFNIFYITSLLEKNSSKIDSFIDYFKKFFPDFSLQSEMINLNSKVDNYSLVRNLLFLNLKEFLKYLKKNNVKSLSKNVYLFIEYPELFLTPHGERELFYIFTELSKLGLFIGVETCSSRFVGIKQYSSICMVKIIKGYSTFYQYRGSLFSGDEVKNFNMNYLVNSDRGEAFFSTKVLLVEGQTDKLLISYLAKKLNIFRYDYYILECGSKSLLPQFIKLLNSFNLKYIAIYDKDNHKWRTPIEKLSSNQKNKQIQKIINYDLGSYLEFSNDIEEELYSQPRKRMNYRNKPFIALSHAMSDDFTLSKSLEEKIKKIYK